MRYFFLQLSALNFVADISGCHHLRNRHVELVVHVSNVRRLLAVVLAIHRGHTERSDLPRSIIQGEE